MVWTEAVLRTLREAGFSADMTHHAFHALDSHITGFTLWQVNMPFETKAELIDMAETFLRQIPPTRTPTSSSTPSSTSPRPAPTARPSSSSGSS